MAKSLSDKRTNVRLLAQTPDGSIVVGTADDLRAFSRKLDQYRTELTRTGKPMNEALIARVEKVRLATIDDISFGEIREIDIDPAAHYVLELWFDASEGADRTWLGHLQRFSATGDLVELDRYFGTDRDVVLVSVVGSLLTSLPMQFGELAEVHLPPSVQVRAYSDSLVEQQGLPSVQLPTERPTVTIAIHDTGIDETHPLITPILRGSESVVPGAGSVDEVGHGTKMAGLALYGDLAGIVLGATIDPVAPIVSVRYLEDGDNDEVLWAQRTRTSIETAEALAETDNVVHNFSWGADNPREHEPTAWSAAMDRMAWNDGVGRVIVVSAGNVKLVNAGDYPALSLGTPHSQPAQAWNVTTVGGVTLLDQLARQDLEAGYSPPVARAGELSPHTTTGPARLDPRKPDVVAEAGNSSPDGINLNANAAGLTMVTTGLRSLRGRELERTAMTSSPAALATRALAQIWTEYPNLRPATVRGLLVHGAAYPAAMVSQLPDEVERRRAAGHGMLNVDRSVASTPLRPVLVFEGALLPRRVDFQRQLHREIVYIELPFPQEQLDEIGEDDVLLQVTLSYFVEPSESERRSKYAGARLRWDMQGPNEDEGEFVQRVNKMARDDSYVSSTRSYDWILGGDTRSHSTLQSDSVVTTGSALAGTRLLAVYPVLGWWDARKSQEGKALPFSVIASLEAPASDIDLYAPISVAVEQLIET